MKAKHLVMASSVALLLSLSDLAKAQTLGLSPIIKTIVEQTNALPVEKIDVQGDDAYALAEAMQSRRHVIADKIKDVNAPKDETTSQTTESTTEVATQTNSTETSTTTVSTTTTTAPTTTVVEETVTLPEQAPQPTAPSGSPMLYTLDQLMFNGVVNWGGYKFTYYSQSVLPGGGLSIPGRHVNALGYVADGDGYIVLANSAPLGTVINTPFGAPGKVYDRGTVGNHFDVYTR